jgi:hypothetical protein
MPPVPSPRQGRQRSGAPAGAQNHSSSIPVAALRLPPATLCRASGARERRIDAVSFLEAAGAPGGGRVAGGAKDGEGPPAVEQPRARARIAWVLCPRILSLGEACALRDSKTLRYLRAAHRRNAPRPFQGRRSYGCSNRRCRFARPPATVRHAFGVGVAAAPHCDFGTLPTQRLWDSATLRL